MHFIYIYFIMCIDEYIYQIYPGFKQYREDLVSKYNFLIEAIEIKEEANG